MISFNQVIFVGNVGTTTEKQKTTEGTPVSRFQLAIHTYAGKDENGKAKEDAMWVSVNCWRDLGERVQKFVTKGALVLVSGRLAIRKYTDKQNQEQTSVEVVASTVELLEKKAKPTAEEATEA